MFINRPSRKRAFAYGLTGLGLALLVAVPVSLASAAFGTTPPPIANCTHYTGTDLTGFIAAAQTNYPVTECLSASGESFTTGSSLIINAPAVLNFEGATVAGTSALKGPMLRVKTTSANTKIADVILTRGAGSGDGIDCRSACTITQTTVEGMEGNGIYLSNAPGSVIGGDTSAAEVSTVGDSKAGLEVYRTAGVTVGYFTSTLDNHYGVLFQTVSGSASAPCLVTSITATDVGGVSTSWGLAHNSSGSGFELLGSGTTSGTGCAVKTVAAHGQGGYGLALGSSSYNTFASVSASGESQGYNNPGINFDSGSAHNAINSATIDHETVGVEIGNSGVKGGRGETGNDYNTFGTLSFTDDTFGAIGIIGGTHNTFSSVTGTGIGNAGGTFYQGLIQFKTNATTHSPDTDNVITAAKFSGEANKGRFDVAKYVVYADGGTRGNSVNLTSVDPVTYKLAPCEQTKGSNKFAGC